MNPLLERALADAGTGSSDALAEFGLERLTVKGVGIPGAGPEWEERLTLTGNGGLALRTRRSIADLSSEPIGEFRQTVNGEAVQRMIQLLREARLDSLPKFRVEPTDLRVRISVTAGGAVEQTVVGVSNPAALMPIKPLLQEMDRLAVTVRAAPVRTLLLGLNMPSNLRAARIRVPVSLVFQNTGTAGYWITHPGRLERTSPYEACGLIYGKKPEIAPGTSPRPIRLSEAALEPAQKEDLDLLWIPAGSQVEQRLVGTMEAFEPGLYVIRAIYTSHTGEDEIGGQPRMRGCVFSNELEIDVR